MIGDIDHRFRGTRKSLRKFKLAASFSTFRGQIVMERKSAQFRLKKEEHPFFMERYGKFIPNQMRSAGTF